MIVSTMNDLPGYRVVEVYGEVFGLTVRSRNLFATIGGSLSALFGGRIGAFTKLLTESREEAVALLRAEAAALGANAVLAMRFDTGEIGNTMNEVAAYGTAVFVEPVGARE
ncbi:MAG TPA: heavy metal-binding domain-containing protein [Acidimicrobiales bacterium]|nr:heavy metal-binding domain-containing protein [Acidimicrobiales bacterium]